MLEGHWHEGDNRDFEFDRADEVAREAEMRPSLSVSEPRRSGTNSLIRLQGELLNFRAGRFAHCRPHHAERNGADPFRKRSGRKHWWRSWELSA